MGRAIQPRLVKPGPMEIGEVVQIHIGPGKGYLQETLDRSKASVYTGRLQAVIERHHGLIELELEGDGTWIIQGQNEVVEVYLYEEVDS